MIAHDFKLPILTEDTLRDFVWLAWGVRIPDKQVCPDHTTPWRAFCDAYFARSPVSVWWASRGFGGKTFLLSLLSLTEGVTLGCDANTLGGSGEQAKRVVEHSQTFWNYRDAPRHMLKSDTTTISRLTNGANITALMASQASVRGPHPARLRCDEIDEMDIDILNAAMGQPMQQRGVKPQTVMSSTRQYADGTMSKILQRAVVKGWKTYTWCYRENMEPHGWLTQEAVDQKKTEVTDQMWKAEYENQEPSPESRAIQPEAVERMFDRGLGEFEGAAHEEIEIEPPWCVCPKCGYGEARTKDNECPQCHVMMENCTYAHGTDWARKLDWTIIATLRTDIRPVKCVAWMRTGRVDWPVMVGYLDKRIARYEGRSVHDGSGVGDVVAGYLNHSSESFIMSGSARKDMLTEYIAACEHGEVVYPFIRYAYSEHKYASVEDVYSSAEGKHLPDSMSAGSLAWRARQAVHWAW